jgi:signal transduction histidine kinase
MYGAPLDRAPRPLQRFLRLVTPDTMGARLVLTGAVLAIATAAATAAIEAWLASPQATAWTGLAALLPVAAAILIGIGLGAWLARIIRGPVLRMVDHVKTQGYLAAEGVPYPGDDLADDRSLPIEFRELGAVVEDLLRHLNARQAELKNAIREAEYAEETLGVVVTESMEAKLVLQDGRIIVANPAAASTLGLPVSQLQDLTASEAMHGIEIRDEQGTRYDATGLLERALGEPVVVSMTEPGRPERWYSVQAVRHQGDLHNRILLTAREVTEERRLASIRAEVVSLVSHDLRSPLTVVIGYLDLLSRPMSPEDHARALDAARRNAARMADLLEDLLSATRAEELLAASELVPTPLRLLAEDVVGSLAPTHSERELLLDADCDPVVLGEERRLRQVLVNLVTNAYKYSPDPDPITVRVRCDESDAYLEVIDHGPGIPAEDRDHAFERFARLENGAGRPGVGLGLYIVNIIAHNHGGSARVEETPGGGATFVVQLPLAGMMVDDEIVLRESTGAPEK